MPGQSYSTVIQIFAKPESVYKAVTCEIDKWWTTSSNEALEPGDRLVVCFEKGTRWVMAVAEAVPDESVVWEVVEAYHNLESVQATDEWKGTTIQWRIGGEEVRTDVTLIHQGLVPELECFEICQAGWGYFLGSLKSYLETGTGYPYEARMAD
ncbi:MAG: SRPBCC domain-containing protein [Rhodothermia bacterium]|nr:SRPBCC domain-containing protein [Rhodothermia bacterium]